LGLISKALYVLGNEKDGQEKGLSSTAYLLIISGLGEAAGTGWYIFVVGVRDVGQEGCDE
jgi:hypothetical protein